MHASAVAGFNQQLNIRIHKRHSHCDSAPVRQDELRIVPELLDDAEDIIPAPTVEARAVLTELIDYLVHFEDRQDGLNQYGTTDGTPWKTNNVLSEVENIVPEPCLKVRFHLGEVEVRPVSILNKLLGVVEEIKTEVEQATRNSFSINDKVLLLKMPSSRAALIQAN